MNVILKSSMLRCGSFITCVIICFLISSVPHSFMLMEKICLIISNKSWMIPSHCLQNERFLHFSLKMQVSPVLELTLITKVMHHFEGPFLWGWARWLGRAAVMCLVSGAKGFHLHLAQLPRPPGTRLVLLTKWSQGAEILEKPVPNRDRFVNKCKICSADQLIAHWSFYRVTDIWKSTLIALDLPLEGWKWNIPGCHFNAAESGWSSDLLAELAPQVLCMNTQLGSRATFLIL